MNSPKLTKTIKASIIATALMLASASSQAVYLPELIQDAMNTDPAILEAIANEEVATSRLDATKAQKWPVFSMQASGNILKSKNADSSQFRGAVGRINVYSAGAIDASIERDAYLQTYQKHKTAEVREQIAYNVASLYLQALVAKELLLVEIANLRRHQKIIDNLQIIVDNDTGRRYELVQAQSRALQVRTRMVQYEKNMRLAISRISRYTKIPVTLGSPIDLKEDSQLEELTTQAHQIPHPSVLALEQEAKSVRADQLFLEKSRWPRIDLEAGVGNQSYMRFVANWDFFDKSSDYTVQSAAKMIVAAERRQEIMQRELAEISETAKASMEQSQLQIQAADRQIVSSAEVAELYEMQFKVGRRSLIELVNAYAEQASVEVSRVNARNDYRLAVIDYLNANAALTQWAKENTENKTNQEKEKQNNQPIPPEYKDEQEDQDVQNNPPVQIIEVFAREK